MRGELESDDAMSRRIYELKRLLLDQGNAARKFLKLHFVTVVAPTRRARSHSPKKTPQFKVDVNKKYN